MKRYVYFVHCMTEEGGGSTIVHSEIEILCSNDLRSLEKHIREDLGIEGAVVIVNLSLLKMISNKDLH